MRIVRSGMWLVLASCSGAAVETMNGPPDAGDMLPPPGLDAGARDAGAAADAGTTPDAGSPVDAGPTTRPLTVTVLQSGNSAPVVGALVVADAQHQGNVNAQGQISWTDVPAVPITVYASATNCGPTSTTITATATVAQIVMTCMSPIRALRVTVDVAGSSTPVTGAYIFVDAQHRGIVDGTGAIQWSDVPTTPFTVEITAPYCNTVSQSLDATSTSLGASMSCNGAMTDQIDLTQAQVRNSSGDIAGWAATSKITQLNLEPNGVFINHTKRDGTDRWPDVPFGTGNLEYTLWIVINVGGQWYTSGCIQYWYDPSDVLINGGPPSGYAMNWYYDPNRWAPMTGYQPMVGELVGFFVSAGNARNVTDHSQSPVLERSNVVMIPFPDDNGAVFNY